MRHRKPAQARVEPARYRSATPSPASVGAWRFAYAPYACWHWLSGIAFTTWKKFLPERINDPD